MNSTALKPISVSRKNDAVIAVIQNNTTHTIEIEGINHAAEILLGYTHDELSGSTIGQILPEEIIEDINSYIEFEPGGDDLAAVLGRMPHFFIKDKEGHKVPVALKVFYTIADTAGVPRYELLMRDNSRQELLSKIRANSNVIEEIGLADSESTHQTLDAICHYMNDHMLEASFAIMHLDQFDTLNDLYQNNQITSILKETKARFEECCRKDDIITYLGNGTFGIVLFDCSTNNAQIVLNRLRLAIESPQFNPGMNANTTITTSTCYMPVNPNFASESIINTCTSTLEKNKNLQSNCVLSAL